MKISVAIATRNEEKNISRCLESVKWADEIIICDQNSSDKTRQLAKKYTSKIFVMEYDPMFHVTKQQAIDRCTGDWILCIDADEQVPRDLKEEILEVIKNNDYAGYKMPRRSRIFGKWMEHTGWYPDYQVKLFRKNKGQLKCETVHEQISVDGNLGTLKSDLLHYHYDSVEQFVERLNRYTTNDADFLFARGDRVVWSDAVRYPVDEFFSRYFSQQGYKDGLHGLVLSLLQSLNRLVVFAKIWEKQKFEEKDLDLVSVNKFANKTIGELNYWWTTVKITEEKNFFRKILLKIKRKIEN